MNSCYYCQKQAAVQSCLTFVGFVVVGCYYGASAYSCHLVAGIAAAAVVGNAGNDQDASSFEVAFGIESFDSSPWRAGCAVAAGRGET